MVQFQCTTPDLVTEADLQIYAQGADLSVIAAHLESCAVCREKVTFYRQRDSGLQSVLWRQTCPSAETLRDYHAGYVSQTQQTQLEAHVAVCPHCQAELREFAAGLRTDEADTSLWSKAESFLSQVGLMVAQLVTPIHSLRPALRGEMREVLLFEAGNTAVSLNVETIENNRFTLHGQVLAEQTPTGRVRLTAVNQPTQEYPLSSTGTFSLIGIPPDQYQLTISLAGQQILLPALLIEA
jgi:hypothetical protein